VCGRVYKIEKFRTLSAPSEIASQFPPPLRSKKLKLKLKLKVGKKKFGKKLEIGNWKLEIGN
jgi:hypothetical protein